MNPKLETRNPKPSLTICMIVRDEADWMRPFLEHHVSLADEVVVVDTGSIDDTAGIAERAGARVIRIEWPHDFAAARNVALDAATGDWILCLDADETIEAGQMADIRTLIQRPDADAYVLTITTYTNDSQIVGWKPAADRTLSRGFSGGYDVPLVRLFRNDPRIRFEGLIHEAVAPSIERAGLTSAACPVVIHHYKELKPARSKETKNLRYLELSRAQTRSRGGDPHVFYELGLAAFECGRLDEAAQAFGRAVELAPLVAEYATHQGVTLTRAGRFTEAGAVYHAALRRLGERPELLAGHGEALIEQRRSREAAAALRRCLELAPDHYRATLNLAVALIDERDHEGALEACRRAAGMNPTDDLVFLNAAVALHGLGRAPEAIESLRQAHALNPHRPQTNEALRRLAKNN